MTTVLETADLGDPKIRDTSPERIRKQVRKVNWGYVLTGMPRAGSPDGALIAGEWLARGGRAWIVRGDVRAALPEKVSRIPEWFNAELLDPARAARYQVPGSFEGDPSRVLPRWTGEAAVQFRVPGRGLIAAGAAADLVLWTTSDGQLPENLRDFRPKLVILNGRVIDVSKPGPAGSGRFIGR